MAHPPALTGEGVLANSMPGNRMPSRFPHLGYFSRTIFRLLIPGQTPLTLYQPTCDLLHFHPFNGLSTSMADPEGRLKGRGVTLEFPQEVCTGREPLPHVTQAEPLVGVVTGQPRKSIGVPWSSHDREEEAGVFWSARRGRVMCQSTQTQENDRI